jgi:hypothetical protein
MNVGETAFYNIIETIQSKVVNQVNAWLSSRERANIRIDDWDTFSLDHTLALVILPALKKFKETGRGSIWIDDIDVPDDIKSIASKPYDSSIGELDEFYEARSNYIIDAMIYSFEKIVDDSWQNEFYSYENDTIGGFDYIAVDYDGNKVDEDTYEGKVLYELKNDNRMKIDNVGIEAVEDKIDFGLLMFGKYYRGLWQ